MSYMTFLFLLYFSGLQSKLLVNPKGVFKWNKSQPDPIIFLNRCIFRGCSVCLPEGVLILTNLVSIVSEFKDIDGIIYLIAVQARMAKIFNDFHFQIFVQIFVFNWSWPKKQHSLYKKSAGKLSRCKKMMGLGFISFDKAFRIRAIWCVEPLY
jgi:hypothetical protein